MAIEESWRISRQAQRDADTMKTPYTDTGHGEPPEGDGTGILQTRGIPDEAGGTTKMAKD